MANLIVAFPGELPAKILKWKIKKGMQIGRGTVLALYQPEGTTQMLKLKCTLVGSVEELLVQEGSVVQPGSEVVRLKACAHITVMKDMCADCGADLRMDEEGQESTKRKDNPASVAMIHSIPELVVSEEQALELGKEDEKRLLQHRKLVLLVDLDQTLIHTTNDNIPANLKDAIHFQLPHGQQMMWYHTKIRPATDKFLKTISDLYELHICSFGVRIYAHTVAKFLDPTGTLFSHRILSRNECFNPLSKTANLKALFPCGDSMVAIIDDREDVWNFIPNLIHVKPYSFFDGTADINAPPGFSKDSEPVPATRRKAKLIRVPRKSSDSDSSPDLEDKSDAKDTSAEEPKIEGKEQRSSSPVDVDDADKSSSDATKTSPSTADTSDEKPTGSADTKMAETSTNGKVSTSIDGEELDVRSTVNTDGQAMTEEDRGIKGFKGGGEDDAKCDGNEEVTESDAVSSTGTAGGEKPPTDTADGKKVRKRANSGSSTEDGEVKDSKPNSDADYDEMVEWEDDDDYLLYLKDILTRIHTAFYQLYDQNTGTPPDLKNIIPYVRRKVLQGVNILFSGVVPLNSAPEKSEAHKIAKALGATIHTEFVAKSKDGSKEQEFTTHVVAARQGTVKVRLAQKQKYVKVVNPDWLWVCADRWEKVEERLFPLPGKDDCNTPRDSPIARPAGKRKHESLGKGKKPKSPKLDSEEMSSLEATALAVSERRFSDSYNPMYAFSSADLADMDKEVDDLLDESSDSSDSEAEARRSEQKLRDEVLHKTPPESSSEDSLSGDYPRGWGIKRSPSKVDDSEDARNDDDETRHAKMFQPSASSSSSENDDDDFNDSVGSVDEEMAAAVEREFLNY